MKNSLLFSLIALLFLSTTQSRACSALFIKRDIMLFGKNFDWYNGEGIVLKNNRGIKKVAYGLDNKNLVEWTSKYGSITFNQIGKEFPYGGMNERGLAIEMLWLAGSQYEESGKPTLSELEWIQYQLDNYKTAAEVKAHLDEININPVTANLHYFIADHGGRSFILEFIGGKAVVSTTTNEYQALTNTPYQSSMKYYEQNKNKVNKSSRKSNDRFTQLMSKVNEDYVRNTEGMHRALSESAEDGEQYKTYWSIVYNLMNYSITFKSYASKELKTINIQAFDFDKTAPILGMDINSPYIYWKIYNPETNLKLLTESLEQAKIKLNLTTANQHMMSPSSSIMDDTYSNFHTDLTIQFSIKKQKGLIFYTVMQGEENYKKYKGVESGIIRANAALKKVVLYSFPVGEYALASYHDLDQNAKMNTFLGIPSEPFAFSNNAKGFFGTPPKYEKAKFQSAQQKLLEIKIR